jgi:hypothetical protein
MESFLPIVLAVIGVIAIILVVRFILGCLPKILIIVAILVIGFLVYFFYLKGNYLP